MSDLSTIQRHRDLWKLGLHLSAVLRRAVKPKAAAFSLVSDILGPLEVRLDFVALATDAGRARARTDLTEAASRVHGEALGPLVSLGWAAGDILPYADVEPHRTHENRPADPATVEAARRFLSESANLVEPARTELADVRGWCEAIAGGWSVTLDLAEYRSLVDEAFRRGAAPEVVDPDVDPPSNLKTATREHVIQMIVMHHILCGAFGLRGTTTAVLRGSVSEGMHAYNDESESHFVVGWNEKGVVGFGFHKYACQEELDMSPQERDPMRHLPGLPDELEPLARTLSNMAGRFFTAGFYLTNEARRIEPGFGDDGSDIFKAFVGPARQALFKSPGHWAHLHSTTQEQAELARTLAKRAMAGGGEITPEETETLLAPPPEMQDQPLFALKEECVDRVTADFEKLGLRLTIPAEVFAEQRRALAQILEDAIAAAMTLDERALLDAARANDPSSIRALLAKGVNPNVASIKDQFREIHASPGMPPLMIALRAGARDAALALIEGGADLKLKVGRVTALQCAVQGNDAELTRLFLERTDGKAAAASSIFWIAAMRSNRDIVELLLDAGGLNEAPPHLQNYLEQLRGENRGEIADLIQQRLEARGE